MIFDILCGICNMAACILILVIDPQLLTIDLNVNIVSYFMIFVLTLTWVRFLMLFMMIKFFTVYLYIILFIMVDTLQFMVMFGCYMLIISSIFTCLFHNQMKDRFGNLGISIRVLFDAVLGTYGYQAENMRDTITISVLLDFHIVVSSIILLNYFVAVLTNAYSRFRKSGMFEYKRNLFHYCERY